MRVGNSALSCKCQRTFTAFFNHVECLRMMRDIIEVPFLYTYISIQTASNNVATTTHPLAASSPLMRRLTFQISIFSSANVVESLVMLESMGQQKASKPFYAVLLFFRMTLRLLWYGLLTCDLSMTHAPYGIVDMNVSAALVRWVAREKGDWRGIRGARYWLSCQI